MSRDTVRVYDETLADPPDGNRADRLVTVVLPERVWRRVHDACVRDAYRIVARSRPDNARPRPDPVGLDALVTASDEIAGLVGNVPPNRRFSWNGSPHRE